VNIVEILTLVATALLGGFLVFLGAQLIKQKTWPSWVKLVLSWVLAALFALATAWKAGDIFGFALAWHGMSSQEFLTYFVSYWTVATVWYHVVFKGAPWVVRLGDWPRKA
jgi:uncharacterized membrane protein